MRLRKHAFIITHRFKNETLYAHMKAGWEPVGLRLGAQITWFMVPPTLLPELVAEGSIDFNLDADDGMIYWYFNPDAPVLKDIDL